MSSFNNFNIDSFFDEIPELLDLELTAPSLYPTSTYATDHVAIKMQPFSTAIDPYATQQQPLTPSYGYVSSSSFFLEPMSMPHFNPFCHLDFAAIGSTYTASAHGNAQPIASTIVDPEITFTFSNPSQPSPAQPKRDRNSKKERLRKRHRGYERAYRKHKRECFKKQRKDWIKLEAKLRKIQGNNNRSAALPAKVEDTSLTAKFKQLKVEEKVLTMDTIYLRSMETWDEATKLKIQRKSPELMNKVAHAFAPNAEPNNQPLHPISPTKFEFSW